jgi:Tfp pilus assembly protein PilF
MGFWKDLKAKVTRTNYGAWLIQHGFSPEDAQDMVRRAEKRDRDADV